MESLIESAWSSYKEELLVAVSVLYLSAAVLGRFGILGRLFPRVFEQKSTLWSGWREFSDDPLGSLWLFLVLLVGALFLIGSLLT